MLHFPPAKFLIVVVLDWQLIVRSHEGPDARDKRPEMEAMNKGYTVDHVVKAGKLITLFSAPDYPQFQVCISTLIFFVSLGAMYMIVIILLVLVFFSNPHTLYHDTHYVLNSHTNSYLFGDIRLLRIATTITVHI